MKSVDALNMISAVQPPKTAVTVPANADDTKLKKVAHQFESMFMTEMIRQARPSDHAAGAFAADKSDSSWRYFMDQALGEAAATNGPAGDTGLDKAIMKSLHDAAARSSQGQVPEGKTK